MHIFLTRKKLDSTKLLVGNHFYSLIFQTHAEICALVIKVYQRGRTTYILSSKYMHVYIGLNHLCNFLDVYRGCRGRMVVEFITTCAISAF